MTNKLSNDIFKHMEIILLFLCTVRSVLLHVSETEIRIICEDSRSHHELGIGRSARDRAPFGDVNTA